MTSSITLIRNLVAQLAALLPLIASAQVLTENFEDGVLDSRISVSTIGSFNLAPGIQPLTNFGSSKAFGFGLSTCGASCFNNYVTQLKINFSSPTSIGKIQFREMELYSNWGSNGLISVNGVALTGALSDFGRLPYNDFVADAAFRTWSFDVNSSVSSIIIGVYDITNRSQIALDDLVITSVPEAPTYMLLLAGVVGVLLRGRRLPSTKSGT